MAAPEDRAGRQGGEQAPVLPAVSLPKGGGAIRGMGEKFAANPVTGTGSMSVPIATSPGRSGFGPQLSLTYDSGSGNGPFGFGWSLSLPAITRKTDKGLPRYLDADESDVFILSGAEDLVPVFRQDSDGSWIAGHAGHTRDAGGSWVRDPGGRLVVHEDELDGHVVRRYRPRIESLFARIERWSRVGAPDDVHWRSISRDNVLTLYGLDTGSRIYDPLDHRHIFSWLICETRDDRGNGTIYRYRPEDGAGVDLRAARERNRGLPDDPRRAANRYLKRVLYGNRTPLLDAAGARPRFLDAAAVDAQIANAGWMFEVVLDYGEHDAAAPAPGDAGTWATRPDAFSSYRPGFEVRTTRRCHRVLMFHHFPDAPDVGRDCLVKSTDLAYGDDLDPHDAQSPVYSFLRSVTQAGYRRAPGGYERRTLPPVEFEYSQPVVQQRVEEVDPGSLENLPAGLDGSAYQWVDLHGEGIPGVLSEQAGAWTYKRNLSPIPVPGANGRDITAARFAPMETVALRPNLSLAGGAAFMDLAGDGMPDLVVMDGPVPGLYEHDEAEGWLPFRPFTSRLNRDPRDPDFKLTDIDGDGHADVLITGEDGFTWHPSLAEDGFGPALRVAVPFDEEVGPHVVFGNTEHSLHLADLSGDGLGDLVRIRNGEVCYWPSLGYGRFGAKVTMDNAPWFDEPDQFDQRRIRLADIDGSGTTDLIYLHRDGVRLYFNQSGNGWSKPQRLDVSPRVDDVVTMVPADLLGNGTACLVWSSPLPGDARRQMRYVNLMGEKPHLLVRMVNNLGAQTRVSYAPSTKFYLQDRRDRRPWISRLPFPVHVVERVETIDDVSRNRFVARYAYHHGYFDGDEREFRGFGAVDEWDTEELAALTAFAVLGADDNIAPASHVPPRHTKTWFHTGVFLGRDRVARQFENEYFCEPGMSVDTAHALLLEDTVLPSGLDLDERREACRALKGSMLRQEVYADDAGPGASPEQVARAATPYTVAEQSFDVKALQARGINRHSVFLAHSRETISYHYERDATDPRIQHALTLEVDDWGTVLKQATVGYGRRATVRVVDALGGVQVEPNPGLAGLPADDGARQTATLVTYTENLVSNAIDAPDWHRAPLPCEVVTFELTGYAPTGAAGRYVAPDLVERDPFAPGRLRHRLVDEVSYETPPTGNACRRPIEWVRTLYRRDDLGGLLPLGKVEPLSLPGEGYRLAFTSGLLAQVYRRLHAGVAPEPLLPDPASVLGGQGGDRGGYVQSQALKADGRFPATDADGSWWLPSGRSFCTPDPTDPPAVEVAHARAHFYLPRRHRDPFGNDASIDYDDNDLLLAETRDALANRTTVDRNDYRVLQPQLVSDPNRNRTAVAFDTLGMVVGTSVMGKPLPARGEGDSLDGFVPDLAKVQLDALFDGVDPHATAPSLLAGASTRIVYDLERFRRTRLANPDDPTAWRPASAATLVRETHAADPLPPQGLRVQVAFSFSDGFGREVQRKMQAEPGPLLDGGPTVAPRWVASGWTIFNNKGKPVRQYEPFFSVSHDFEFGMVVGVSPILFYDPVDRLIATLHPDHTFEKVVFDPWRQTTYDGNDTSAPRGVQTGDPRTDPDIGGYVSAYFRALPVDPAHPWQTWHAQRIGGALGPDERDAAARTEAHADTPTTAHFDVLGRTFLTVARNRVVCAGHDLDGTEATMASRVELDIEGNQRAVRDAVVQAGDVFGRVVTRYAYDMLGTRVHQLSMEAGARWTLNDAGGKPIRSWDGRGHEVTTSYDSLRRPLEQVVRGTTADSDPRTLNKDVVCDRIEYGEPPVAADQATQDRVVALNLRTRVYRHFDSAGVAVTARLDANGDPVAAYDFKGNPLHSARRLVADYAALADWSGNPVLSDETFEAGTLYDGLNRPVQSITPKSSLPRAKRNVIQPAFNEANLLERVDVWLERGAEPGALIDPAAEAPSTVGVANIDYDAKGQRLRIDYRNGASTSYGYDPLTFRLTGLYTRRGPAFTGDSDNPQPPPATIAAPDAPPVGTSAGLQNLHYTYDPAGNITHIRDDAQSTVYFSNQRVEPSNDYTYDATYRLIQATGREHLGQAGGVRNSPTPPDAANGFHTRQVHPGDGGAMGTYIERFVYDAVGNFLAVQHRGSDPANLGWTRAYAYAEPSLIEDGSDGGPTKTSNRLSQSTLNPGSINSVQEPYAHDPHGNMVRMPHLGGGQPGPNMHWDFRDQLLRVDLGGGGVAHYVYDASGLRVRKVWEKAPGMTEERIYLGGFEIFRRHAGAIGPDTATFERETLHVTDDKRRMAIVETRTLDTAGADQAPGQLIRYQLGNHVGSASLELDDGALIISYEEYSPYGSSTYQAVRKQTETPKRYRYTGKERDEESGLCYFGARYYAPWIGRWTSGDPVRKDNLYSFVRDNPVSFVDPDGKDGGFWDRVRHSDTVQFLGGAAAGGLSGLIPGGFLIAPVGQETGMLNRPSRAFQAGYGAGEIATGVVEAVAGAGGEVGGVVLDATGVGALVGVPVNIASAAVIVQGAGNVTAGIGNFVQAIRRDPEPAQQAPAPARQPQTPEAAPPPQQPPPSKTAAKAPQSQPPAPSGGGAPPAGPAPGVRESSGASPRGAQFQSASAQTPRSVITAVRADVAESQAYMEALRRGEIGLQRPGGANVPGTDFITARIRPDGAVEVLVTDVKASTVGRFPRPSSTVPTTWHGEVNAAVSPGRLNLNDPALESRIRDAVTSGRVVPRQVNVNYSPSPQGQGRMTGF
jgi:RHS repeat-associated protein